MSCIDVVIISKTSKKCQTTGMPIHVMRIELKVQKLI